MAKVLYEGGKEKKGISHIALSFDESLVYITEVQGNLLCFDRASGEKKFEIEDIKGNFKVNIKTKGYAYVEFENDEDLLNGESCQLSDSEIEHMNKLDIEWYLANGYITAEDYRKQLNH